MQTTPSHTPSKGITRLQALVALAALLLLLALGLWREPFELWRLQRAPMDRIEQYAAAHPLSLDAQLLLAQTYIQNGRSHDAVALSTELQRQHPTDIRVLTLLARAQLEAGDLQNACANLKVALFTLQDERPDTRWWLGQSLERVGRPEEAFREYEALLERDPEHGPTLVRLGDRARQDGHLTEAQRYYERALRIRKTVDSAAGLAEVLFRQGQIRAAIAAARDAAGLDPGRSRAHLWLARGLQAENLTDHARQAEAAYARAIELSQDAEERSGARFYLAQLLRELGRTNDALTQLEANVHENPLHKPSYQDIVLLARRSGNFKRAESALHRARLLSWLENRSSELEYRLSLNPGDLKLRMELARFYAANGRPDLARPQVQWVLRQKPRHMEAHRLQSQISQMPEPSL